MKKGILLATVGLLVAPMLFWVGVAQAHTFRSSDTVFIREDQTVNNTLYASGRTIDVAGTVDGDVICAGQNIIISGTVDGDVICAGQNVRIAGDVAGDVRAAAQTVTVSGEVGGNLSALSQTVVLGATATVARDVSIAAGDVTLNGVIDRDLAVAATTVIVADRVGRDIQATVDELTIAEQARVGGDVTYTSAQDAVINQGAQIAGTTSREDPPEPRGEGGAVFALTFGVGVYVLLSLLVVALAVVLLFPRALKDTTQRALDAPGKTALIGLVANLAVPVLILALALTIIGAPLALLLLLLWLVVQFLAGPFTGYYVGRLLFRNRQTNAVIVMLVGSLVVLLLYFIPIIGAIAMIAVVILGTGMILSELMRRTPRPSYDHAHSTTSKR